MACGLSAWCSMADLTSDVLDTLCGKPCERPRKGGCVFESGGINLPLFLSGRPSAEGWQLRSARLLTIVRHLI